MTYTLQIIAVLTLWLLPCMTESTQARTPPSDTTQVSYIGDVHIIQSTHSDTLAYIARDYNLGHLEIIAANRHLDPWMPGENTNIIIPARHILPDAPHNGIVINLAEMRLYAFHTQDKTPQSFPLGIGREGLETPLGTTHITRKTRAPTWRPTERMREEDPTLPEEVQPGKNNPLGSHALYLGWPEYLIHGTNRPFGIGRRVSSGCVRMYPEDIKQLYAATSPNTPVTVLNQPIKAAWINGSFYIEAHTTASQSVELDKTNHFTHHPLSETEKTYITHIAGQHAEALNWETIKTIAKARTGIPTRAFTP